MKKIALIGLETNEGSEILNELMVQDYVITAMAKNPFDLPGSPLIIACDGELKDVDVVAGHAKELENDVLICGLHLESEENPLKSLENLVAIAKKSAVRKLIFLGHADEEKQSLNIALKMKEILHDEDMKSLNWIAVNYSSTKLQGIEKEGYGISVDGIMAKETGNYQILGRKDFARALVNLINQDEYHHQMVTMY